MSSRNGVEMLHCALLYPCTLLYFTPQRNISLSSDFPNTCVSVGQFALKFVNELQFSSVQLVPEMTMGHRVTGHGSTNLSGSRGSRVSTRDPLTHDQVNKILRTGYFVAAMMFDFESTSTQWS